jgi:hypothetical protein
VGADENIRERRQQKLIISFRWLLQVSFYQALFLWVLRSNASVEERMSFFRDAHKKGVHYTSPAPPSFQDLLVDLYGDVRRY